MYVCVCVCVYVCVCVCVLSSKHLQSVPESKSAKSPKARASVSGPKVNSQNFKALKLLGLRRAKSSQDYNGVCVCVCVYMCVCVCMCGCVCACEYLSDTHIKTMYSVHT